MLVRPSSDSNSDHPPPGGDGVRGSRGGSGQTATATLTPMFEVRLARPSRSCGSRQLEYCFSIGNLRKGVLLRTQMDVGGFVDLVALSRFGPIAALAADATELVDAACGSYAECSRRPP